MPRRISPDAPSISSCWTRACPIAGNRIGPTCPRCGATRTSGRPDRSRRRIARPRGASSRCAGLPREGPDPHPRAPPIPALCRRTARHGRGALRRRGARPGHPQQHRRRRRVHRQSREDHLSQRRRRRVDRLVVGGRRGTPRGRGDPDPGWRDPRAHPGADGDGDRAGPDRAPAARTASSSAGMDSRRRSRTRLRPSTIANSTRPAPSSSSAT